MALFGAQRPNVSPHLIEFKAGKLKYDEAEKKVKPDPRKGTVYITHGEDGITHFCWKERQASTPEDELMVFPDDVEFLKVKQCTTGRVYVLRFKVTSRKLFFWMQEPNADKDVEIAKKVNDYVNGRNMPGTRTRGGAAGGLRSALPAELQALGIDENNLHEYFGDVDQEQLGQLFSGQTGSMAFLSNLFGGAAAAGAGGANAGEQAATGTAGGAGTPSVAASNRAARVAAGTATPLVAPIGGTQQAKSDQSKATSGAAGASAAALGSGANIVQLADLQRALQGVSTSTNANAAAAAALRAAAASSRNTIDLSNTLTREALEPLLTKPDFVQRLVQHLPDDPRVTRDKNELIETIQSPQFVNVAKSFSEAFSSGRLGTMLREFGCPPPAVAAADTGNLQEFVRVMEEEAAKKKDSTGSSAATATSTGTESSTNNKPDAGGAGGGTGSNNNGGKDPSTDMDLD